MVGPGGQGVQKTRSISKKKKGVMSKKEKKGGKTWDHDKTDQANLRREGKNVKNPLKPRQTTYKKGGRLEKEKAGGGLAQGFTS